MRRLLSDVSLETSGRAQARCGRHRVTVMAGGAPQLASRAPHPATADAMSLHLSKLRGITERVRGKLKRRGITYTHQLVEAAGCVHDRRALAASSGIDDAMLRRLVLRADLLRIRGIGAIFADMLELLGVDRSVRLAQAEPRQLHAALAGLNAAERFARRAPTPEEVRDWVGQARALPPLIADDARPD